MANRSVSDDEISLTSTVGSDQASEYEVETILAETEEHYPELPDGMKYLVKWLGYPLDRCTWEPEVSFNQPESLRDWEEKKQQMSKGELPAFDVSAWEQDLLRKEEEKEERRARRAAKRQRIASSKENRSYPPDKSVPTVKRTSPDKRLNALNSHRSGPSRSLYTDRIHPARQGLIRPPIPSKPPPVSFGMKETAPKPKKALNDPNEPHKVYTLSWKYKFQKGRNRPPEPNIDQLDLRRPSDWDSAPSAKAGQPSTSLNDSPIDHGSNSPRQSHSYQPSPIMSPGLNNGSFWDLSSPRQSEASANQSRATTTVQNTGPWATYGDPDPKFLPREPRSHTAMKKGTRPPAGEFNLRMPPRTRNSKSRTFPTFPPNRWWNPGELYVQLYFGPDRVFLKEARICGIDHKKATGIFKLKSERTKKIEVWFSDLCTLDQYQVLCDGMPNNKIANGWIEGFNDNEANIHRAAVSLWQKDQVAIARINDREVLLAYPPGSRDFDFLDDAGHHPKGYLNLALRGALGPTDRLWSIAGNSHHHSAEHNSTGMNMTPKDSAHELTAVNKSSNVELRQSSNVAQKSDVQSSITLRPTLKPLNTTLPTPAPSTSSFNSPATQVPDRGLAIQQQNNLSTDTMELELRPAKASTSENTGMNTTTVTPNSVLNSPIIDNSSMHGDNLPLNDPMDIDSRPTPAPAPGHAKINHTQVSPATNPIDLDVLFRDKFGITFQKLASFGRLDKKVQMETIFYVWFPDDSRQVENEKELILEFLHKHTSLLFSNNVDVHWSRFVNIVRKKTMQGVVLFHESFVEYDKIPFFKDLLHKSASFWNVSLSQPLRYVDNRAHAQRLFPHGGVFLLTEDFMVREPCATVIILEWFNWWARKKFPGNWKIMLRPGILDWLLERIEQGGASNARWWLAIHCALEKLGFSSTDDVLPTLEVDTIDSLVISPPILPNYGSRTADDSSGIPKECNQEQRNTDHLGEFFAGWSLTNAHRFRRFFMVTALEPLERWKKWQHVQLDYQAFFRDQGVDFEAIHANVFKETPVVIPSIFESISQPQAQKALRPSGTPTPTSGSEQPSGSASSRDGSKYSYGQGYQ
ncbi:hypothetical protein BDV18DRAFT_61155 [Aspergillus unguis]